MPSFIVPICPESGLLFGRHDYRNQADKAAAAVLNPRRAKTFTAYDLRHLRLMQLADSGNWLGTSFIGGHKRASTTDRYLRPTRLAGFTPPMLNPATKQNRLVGAANQVGSFAFVRRGPKTDPGTIRGTNRSASRAPAFGHSPWPPSTSSLSGVRNDSAGDGPPRRRPDPLLAEVVPLARPLRAKRFPTVSECSMPETAPRLPCSRTSCRYDLAHRSHQDHELTPTRDCALEVAAEGAHTLEQVALVLGMSKERVRQIEESALAKLKQKPELRRLLDEHK